MQNPNSWHSILYWNCGYKHKKLTKTENLKIYAKLSLSKRKLNRKYQLIIELTRN